MEMLHSCYNMTWTSTFHSMGRTYLGLAIPAFIFHVLFWIQVATHRSLRQFSMLWVYNYLFTDMLLLIQFFAEFILRMSLPYCISHSLFTLFCNIEAYTPAYITVLEAYMLVGLNVTRYYLIAKNCNIATRYPCVLVMLNIFLYFFGISILLIQVKSLRTVFIHPHYTSSSCHFQYNNVTIQIGNLMIILIIPIILNCYFMTLTTIHVRQSQQAVRTQHSKHSHLLVQFFVLYILWLILWAPNAIVSHILSNNMLSLYTRIGSIISALCDPLIFMFIDRRFLKVWKNTVYRLTRCGQPQRQVHPTTVSHELRLPTYAK